MGSGLSNIVLTSRRIVFFGGAGVSTESGIPDFRSASGLYANSTGSDYPPEVLLSASFFREHTEEFFAFYRSQLLYPNARPNAAHWALAALERMKRLKAVVTQNIDGLHQAAGSRRVLELHGSVHRNRCVGCRRLYDLAFVLTSRGIPRCPSCGNVVRPDIVLYEEALNRAVLADAARAISKADTLIVGGTSLAVYPAAGLVTLFRGSNLVIINAEPTPYDHLATLRLTGSLSENLGPLVELVP